jgi:hypothetical protein
MVHSPLSWTILRLRNITRQKGATLNLLCILQSSRRQAHLQSPQSIRRKFQNSLHGMCENTRRTSWRTDILTKEVNRENLSCPDQLPSSLWATVGVLWDICCFAYHGNKRKDIVHRKLSESHHLNERQPLDARLEKWSSLKTNLPSSIEAKKEDSNPDTIFAPLFNLNDGLEIHQKQCSGVFGARKWRGLPSLQGIATRKVNHRLAWTDACHYV